MSRGTFPVAFLLSCLLHSTLAAVLWSLHAGGREVAVRLVEVTAVTEWAPGSRHAQSLVPERPTHHRPRWASPGLRMRTAAPTVPASKPLGPSDTPMPLQAANEPPRVLAPTDESLRGQGVLEEEGRPVSPGASGADPSSSLVLPGGGYQVRPVYPEAARREGIEGTTVLKIHILEDGSVGDVIIAQSAGHPALDQAAVDAVQRWRFEPARRGGYPVTVWASLPVRFRLE